MTALLYGATGYTGRLIARTAVQRGLRPILAGRSEEKLAPLARELGLPHRAFGLDRPGDLRAALSDVDVLLNASGPFRQTAPPLVAAALQTGTHYLDLAGEVPEFEALAARDGEARAAGVMLLPGVGFGVLPTDSLAVHLARRLPGATHLTLAFWAEGGVSRGTAETLLTDLPHGGVARRGGLLIPEMAGVRTRRVLFGTDEKPTLSNPWRGDLSTAYRSTGIGNIETYAVVPPPVSGLMRASRFLAPLLATRPVQNLLLGQARRQPEGPSDAERAAGFTAVWGEVRDPGGHSARALLKGPEAYTFSALTAVAAVRAVLDGAAEPGFQTPAGVFGPDAVLGLPGVERRDV